MASTGSEAEAVNGVRRALGVGGRQVFKQLLEGREFLAVGGVEHDGARILEFLEGAGQEFALFFGDHDGVSRTGHVGFLSRYQRRADLNVMAEIRGGDNLKR